MYYEIQNVKWLFFLDLIFFYDWLLHISAKYRYGVRNGYTHITFVKVFLMKETQCSTVIEPSHSPESA